MRSILSSGSAALLVLLVGLPTSHAQSRPDRTLQGELTESEALLDSLQYEEARARLEAAARDPRLRRAPARLRAKLFATLGRARAELGDLESADASFREAVRLDPRVQLSPRVSPKIRDALESARSRVGAETPAPPAPRPRREVEERPYRPLPRKEPPPPREPKQDLPYRPLPRKETQPPRTRTPPPPPPPVRDPVDEDELPPIPGSEEDDPWAEPAAPEEEIPPLVADTAPPLDDAWSRPPRRTVATGPIRSGLSQGEIIGLSIAGAAVAIGLATLVAILASDGGSCDPASDPNCSTGASGSAQLRF
ncbi:MAG: tetratricopeptide repeat protein [Myxococcota bacterium]